LVIRFFGTANTGTIMVSGDGHTSDLLPECHGLEVFRLFQKVYRVQNEKTQWIFWIQHQWKDALHFMPSRR